MRTETTPQRAPGLPLLIGEAPPPSGLGPLGPFDCDSGDKLAGLLTEAAAPNGPAWTREEALAAFERVNVLERWPGKAGKGSRFPVAEARQGANAIVGRLLVGQRVVLAGKRVASAFGLLAPIGAWVNVRGTHFTVIPHPSGSTRDYNCALTRVAAGSALLRAIERCRAEREAEVRIAPAAWYHYGRGQFRGDLDQARRAIESATLRVFRWCATSIVSDRAHEPLAAVRAYARCKALGLSEQVAVRSAAIDLIHDRHEPVAGDMASPVKPLLADDWRPIEQAAARAVADLYAGDAPLGSPLRPLADPAAERQAQEQAHAADLDCAAIEAAWWHPTASDRVQADPLCGAARRAAHLLPGGLGATSCGGRSSPALDMLEVAAAGLDRAAWRGYEDLRAALDALAAELPALPLPGGEVGLAR